MDLEGPFLTFRAVCQLGYLCETKCAGSAAETERPQRPEGEVGTPRVTFRAVSRIPGPWGHQPPGGRKEPVCCSGPALLWCSLLVRTPLPTFATLGLTPVPTLSSFPATEQLWPPSVTPGAAEDSRSSLPFQEHSGLNCFNGPHMSRCELPKSHLCAPGTAVS